MCIERLSSLFVALVCLAFSIGAAPQPSTAHFKMLTTNEGLPDNSVNDIVEDHFGFIWIATWNGLARFDGKYVTSYRHSDGVEGTLSNNMVRCLLPDPEGIWVGSDNGLDFMRYSDGRFTQAFYVRDGAGAQQQPLSGRVSRMISSGDRIFLLTVDGDLMRMDRDHSPADPGARNVFVQLARPASRRYADLAVFKGGRILALSNEGVTLLSPDGSEELYHNSIPAYFDSNMNIYCDNSRSTVTIGGGIGTVTSEYTVDGNGRLEATGTQTPYRSLMSTAFDGNTQYYGTDGNGLYIRTGDEVEHFMPSNSSLPSDAIYKVSVDSRHNLWIGTYRHGLAMLSHQLNTYTVNNMASRTLSYDIVTAVVPDGDKLYLGLDGGGLEIVDTLSGERRVFNMSNSAIPGNNIVSMVKDGPIIWAAVYSVGLVAFDTRSESFTTYRANNKIEPGNKLWVLALDGQGRLWVGGSSLSVFDRQNNTFRVIAECRHAQINSIADDPSGNLWVATRDNGLLEIDKNSGEVIDRHSSSPSAGGIRMAYPRPHLVYVDSRRNLWIAFDNSRLVRLNLTDRNDMEGYDMRYGSARGNVMSVVEDAGGNLLMGTDNGLVRYSRTRNNMMSLTDERMPKIFAQNSAARSGKTVYFGTTAGLLCYPLNNPLQAMPMPPTVFTGIEILGDDGVVLPLFCTGDSVVTLEHSQNFFKVRFALPEMSSPGQIMFECRLEGLEDGWRDVSDTRWATYTNVPSGSYRMMVRHSLSDGSWSEPSVLGITVSPAWYATAGMLIIWTLTGLVVTVMLLYFWRAYAANRDRTRMVEMERDSATRLNEAKLDFYASVTHELRTPCFLISAQIEEIYDSGRQTVPVNSLVGIYRNSAKLNKLISHIIDFRKTETGHLTLNARNIDLVTLLRELSVDYEQLCRQKSLTFSFRHDQPPVFACVDADKVELIVTNLVSNAYKYTPKGGEVSLDLRDVGEAVEISVTDNGIGVMDKLQSTIFEPFVRTERGQKVSRGDGIGLSFVKELVELHRGSIRLDSQVNEGSCFTVILPKYQKESDVDDESVTRLEPSRKPELMKESLAGEISLPDRISDPTSTRSILIIDDNQDVLSVLTHAFESGYRVTRMSDAAEAVELARGGGFDVVITDLMMPEFDGHQVLRELKSDPRTRDIKVVVFSALTSEDDMLQAFDEGADAYLTKPTPVKVLLRQVERLFEKRDDGSSLVSSGTPAGTYNREEQKFLLECRRVIDECMTDENFGIGMLAQRLAMSHSALYKKIRGMTGMSLIDFINEYRIYKAVQFFRDGNTNVQTVAEMCGFRDVKTFRETFKRKMQMPPKQYILSLRGGGSVNSL